MMIKQRTKRSGFTLMELLIAIAIVAILAAIAIPTYLSYTQRAQFSEVVQAADQLKTAVAACIDANGGDPTNCDGGSNGIPADGTGVNNVGAFSVAAGVINVAASSTGTGAFDTGDEYILTPTVGATGISWAVTCNGNTPEYAANCP